MSAYRCMVSCFAWSYHRRRSRHNVEQALCSRCASMCSFSRFVTSGWYFVLAVTLLVYIVRSSCKCCCAVSVACATQ